MEKDKALEVAKIKCFEHGHKLLYLTKHGSHLYGTDTEESDTDYKGIILPDLKFLALMNRVESIRIETKKDRTQRNTKDDCDIELYSLQFWLNKLVKEGETEGIELLYSYTNQSAAVFCDPIMENIFFYKTPLFDPRNTEAFIGFALNQARKYFVKAERFNVIKDIWIFLNGMSHLRDELKLEDVMDEIVDQFYHPTYCMDEYDEKTGINSLYLCGKCHQETISLNEFFNRLTREYEKYGHRTIRAAEMGSKDWKSLSHALKAIIEVRCLLTDGHVDFPLAEPYRSLLRDIKKGEVAFEVIEQHIMQGIDDVDRLKLEFPDGLWGYDAKHVSGLIAKCYGL